MLLWAKRHQQMLSHNDENICSDLQMSCLADSPFAPLPPSISVASPPHLFYSCHSKNSTGWEDFLSLFNIHDMMISSQVSCLPQGWLWCPLGQGWIAWDLFVLLSSFFCCQLEDRLENLWRIWELKSIYSEDFCGARMCWNLILLQATVQSPRKGAITVMV